MLSTSCLCRFAAASSSDCEEAAAEATAAATANIATVNGCSRLVTPAPQKTGSRCYGTSWDARRPFGESRYERSEGNDLPRQAPVAELEYPFHDRTITVTRCGRICFGRQKINLSNVFAGQNVGVKEVSERIWLVTFMDYDLGFFDDETCRLESAINPFEPRVLPMSPGAGINRYLSARNAP